MKKSSTKTTSKTQPVVAPVVDIVAEPKAPKAKRTKSVAAEAKVEDTAALTENVILDDVVDDVVADNTTDVARFIAKIQELSAMVTAVKCDFKIMEKKWAKDIKIAQKTSHKKKRKTGNRAPSGFVKPTLVSDELAIFLGKPLGIELARTQVTREINDYIRTNSLQDKENGRRINPDEKLTTLLKISPGEELTYFNLQRFMSPHFFKNVKVEAVVPVVEA
jgi:chromatin remodeling complex protein RSC6